MPKPLSVLNIEDTESDSDLIAHLLKKAGYKITFERVETETQMRAALKKRAWDVIISDHSLPQFDSYSALALLHEEGLDIPFIAVSGTIGEEAVVEMMRAGAHDFLIKSNLARLVPAVERELEYAKVRRERKEVEDALRDNEMRFRSLIENSLDDISLLAADGTLIWESPSVIRNLGYAPDEFLNRNMFELVHPHDLEWVQKLLSELVQKPASRQSGTFRLKHNDGSWRWVEAIATNMLDEPSVQAIVVNYRDVTERKKVEQELQSSEQLFRELVDNIDEVFWMTDPVSMQDIYISPAHKKVWGRALKDVDEFIETVQLEDRPIVSAALEMQKHGEKTDIRYRVTHLDGSIHWVWDRAFPVFDDSGNLKSVAGIATDITERKQVEQEIQQSEERFHSLFNSMLDGVYRSTHEGKFLDVNPAMVKMFGYSSREEMLAVDIKKDLYFGPEERGSHVLDTGQEEMDVYRMRCKDGSEIWVEDHGTYIHDEQGNIIYHEGILRDITERKRADQVLAESEERFRQAIAAADAIPYNLQYYPRKYTYIGEGIKELAGYSFEEVTPDLLDTLIVESVMLGGFKGMSVPESVKLVREGQSKVLWQCEHRIRTRSGEERWLVDSSIQILGADGIPTGSIGMFQDITERKNAEMEIKERADDVELINTLNEAVNRGESLNAIIKLFTKTLSQLIHSNEVTFYLPSSDGNSLVMQNMDRSLSTIKKVERLIGRPIPQIQIPIREGSFFHRVLRSEKGILSADPEAIQSWMGEFIETEYLPKAIRGGMRALVPQIYKLMNIHSLISIPLVSDNKIIASFDVTSSKIMTEIDLHRVQKISSQVAAVILRKIAEEKLYQTTQELKLLIEASPAAIITFTPENVVKSWNYAAEKIFGYKENEVVGRVAPHIAATEVSEFHTLLEKLQQNEALENIELTRHRKDGTPIYISLNTALTYEADNHLNGYMAIITDITERKKSEEKLEQRARELQTLYETSMDVHSQASLDTLLSSTVKRAVSLTGTSSGGVYLMEPHGKSIKLAFGHNLHKEYIDVELMLGEGLSGQVAQSGKPINLEDYQTWPGQAEIYNDASFHQVLGVPLRVNGKVIGVLTILDYERTGLFSEEQVRLVTLFANQAALAIDHARLYQSAQLEIAERKQVEAALRGSEQRYHALFEDMPVAIWEEDFSEVKKRLDLMKGQGVTDFRSYFESNPGAVREYNAMIKVLDVNQATLKLYHANSKEELLETVDEAPSERMMAQLCDVLTAIAEGKSSHTWEGADETITGEPIEVSLSWSVASDHEVDFSRVIVTTLDITKRKQAEDALRESQSLYHSLVEVSPLSICRKDLAGRFTFANRRFLELSETTLTDLVGLTDFDLHPSELAEKYRRDDQAVIDGGQVQELIEERMIIGGKHTSVQTIKAPIYGGDGMVSGVQISFWDVTDSKQAEEALRRSEERYRALFEDMPIAIWEEDFSGAKKYLDSLKEQGVKDLRAYFTYNPEAFLECGTLIKVLDVNQATLDMYHANSKEDLYKNMDDGLNQNEVEHILDALVAISEGQTSHRWEGADDTVTGEPIEISLSWAVVPGYEDDFSKVIATTMDITARKQTEQALKKSEQRYHTLFEEMPIAIWEEDFSDVKKYLDSLKDKGVTDLRAYFESDPNAVLECYTMIKVLDVNQAALKMYRAESKAALLESLDRGPGKGELEHLIDDLIAIAKGRVSKHWEGADETFEGKSIETSLNWTVAPGYEADFSKVIVTTMDITDRKQAQQALEQSEKRFRSLIANAGDLIVVVNSLGVIQFASPSSERILGYSPEEAVGSNLSEWVHPQDLSEVLEKLAHRSHGPGVSPESIQARGRHKDGSWRILDTIGTNLIDEPAIRGIVLNIRDITERKAAEDEIKSLARFPDENPTPVLRLSEEGIILYANKASQMLLEEWESVINQTAPAFWVQKIAEVFETQTQQVLDVELNTRVLSFVIAPIIGEGYVNLYARDITERRSTEEALRASEAQFRAIFEGAAIGIALVAISGHPVRVNSALQEMLGYDAEELRSMVFTDFTHPDDITIDWDLWGELTDGRRESYQIEKRLIHKDGHIIWVKLTSSIVPGADGKILFGVGMVEDITERKQAEEQSKYQLAELEALYENGLAISRLLEPKRIAQRMVEVIDQKLDWHHAAVRFYDATTDHVELLALNTPGFNEDQIAEQIKRINQAINTPDKGLSGWVIRHGEVIRVGKLKDDPRYFESYAGINSGLYIPIRTGDEVIGSITVESEEENAFSERDANTLTTLANQAAIAFVNARLYLWLQKELDERERAEEEIRKLNIELEQRVAERTAQIEVTKRRLELATHAGQIGVWEYIPRENKVIWDERMHMIHHIPVGDFAGTSEAWGNIIHPDDIGELHINRQLALTKNLLMNNEHRINWPDGSVHHIMASAVMAHSADGTPERLIGINMDITERKMIEQSLRESENYARLLFDAVPDPVSVTDAGGLIVDVNKAFEKQFSTSRDESRGKRISELGIYPQAEVGKREEYITDVLQGRTVKPVELEFYVPGDRIHTLELHSYLLKVNGRQLVLNTSHDITLHKKAEEVQRLAKAEMERALRIKNEFLANMSHELRTPLNSILGISESLEEQIAGTLNEKQLKYIGIVRESGRHLLELINDILDLSKIEAGRMELDIHKISVETLCESSLRMIRELSQKKSLRVSFHNRGEIKIIRGDQRRLKQSLVNLLSNAVKFTPEGKEIGLEVSGNMETNEIEFTVWDQGVGIVEEDIKLLFKPFVQLDAGLAREYQGTGLGLALVSQMVHLHGGRVSVESKVWQGSRFTITLPWSPNEQAPRAQITAELLIPSPRSSAKRNGRILLVEDTDVVVQLISEYLRHKGYEIILANNGVEGIELAAQGHPDLILMDVMMPIMDGLEATRRIRANESLQNIPIIALTALAMSGDSERCLAAGMNDYLSKPIRMQDLANMIEKYLKPAGEESNEQ